MSTVSDAPLSDTSRVTNGIRLALGISGALAVLFGVLILAWPLHAAAVVTLLIAIYAIAGGLVYAGLGIFSQGLRGWARVGHIVVGVIYVIAGILIFANLTAAVATLALFVGIFVGIAWIVEGAVALSTLDDSSSRGWTVFFAIISILAGISLLFSPIWGAAVLWWLVGISAVVLGVVQIVRAFSWGRSRTAI